MKIITLPPLAAGEIYAGIVLNEEGAPSHHLILLPGDNDAANWQAQIDWAKLIGGELPTRREQSLLYANCKQHFEQDGYWSGEEYSAGSAWCQCFGYGGFQGITHDDTELRARAVRRLVMTPIHRTAQVAA